MRVEFEVTPDDMVNATLRALDRSAAYRNQRTRSVLVMAVIVGVLTFFALAYGLPGESLRTKLLIGVFAAVIGGVIQLFTERSTVERR